MLLSIFIHYYGDLYPLLWILFSCSKRQWDEMEGAWALELALGYILADLLIVLHPQ